MNWFDCIIEYIYECCHPYTIVLKSSFQCIFRPNPPLYISENARNIYMKKAVNSWLPQFVGYQFGIMKKNYFLGYQFVGYQFVDFGYQFVGYQ